MQLIRRSGQRLQLNDLTVSELLSPQEVKVFRVPAKVLGKVINFWGVMALHNNARGPYKGGIRLASDVTLWETVELSRLMTLKTAVTDIEFGGGKTGIRVNMRKMYETFDRKPPDRDFEKIISLDAVEYYAQIYRNVFSAHVYIPAPDMGTGPDEMAFIFNETQDPASVTGKPEGTHGWLPGRREATGYGCCFVVLKVLKEILNKAPDQATVAVQGFGNVGGPLVRYLTENGLKVVAITDLYGGARNADGLNYSMLREHTDRVGSLAGFPGDAITNEELLALDVDVLIPAATGHVLTRKNAQQVRAKAIVEAANMPTSVEAMEILEEMGVYVVPDILANAGGVIASMEEYSRSLSAIKMTQQDVFSSIEGKIGENLDLALDKARLEHISLTEAAVQIATDRVYQVMKRRRYI